MLKLEDKQSYQQLVGCGFWNVISCWLVCCWRGAKGCGKTIIFIFRLAIFNIFFQKFCFLLLSCNNSFIVLSVTPFRFLFRGLCCTNDLSWLLTSPSSWFSSCVPYCVNLRPSLSFSLKAAQSQSESDGLSEWGNHSGKPSDSDYLHRPAAACHHYTHLHW